MKIKELEKQLLTELDELRAYNHALELVNFDHETDGPVKAADERNSTMVILGNIVFKKTHNPEFEKLVYELYENKDKLNPYFARTVNSIYKDYQKTKNITPELDYEASLAFSKAHDSWLVAKNKKDYAKFLLNFKQIIDYSRRFLELRDERKKTLYDACLDDYEPGFDSSRMDKFFEELKAGIVPLVKKVIASKKVIREDFLSYKVRIPKQEKFSNYLLKLIGFDMKAGKLSTTEHPFTTMISAHDVRVTTHYYENMFLSNVFSTIHEGGHAIFAQNEPSIFHKYHCNDLMTSAMHECMSRMYENMVARSKGFIHAIYPKFSKLFKNEFKDVSEKELYEGVNVVHPSLIRIEADELTYCLHIIIRYEIERDLMNGVLTPEDAPSVWNKKYQEYLGVTPTNDSEGILQDVHWSSGSFGYFPSYALGNAYAAQLFHKMNQDFDVDATLSEGRVTEIKKWLAKHAFPYASMMDPDEWIVKVTGEPLNTKYYLDYLNKKFTELYEIDE